MTIFEFLQNPILNLPKANQSRSYEMIFIDSMNEYLDLLTELEDFKVYQKDSRLINAKELSNKAYSLGKGIINTLKEYYDGKPYEAFYSFKAILDEFDFIFKTETTLEEKDLYRIRVTNRNMKFTTNEFFHIPYQLKHKNATQRYSIPGFPSLHLSDSIYTCWEELKRPSLENMHVSRFKLAHQTLQVLEIPRPIEIIQKNVIDNRITESKTDSGIASLLINFPLYLACSIGIKSPHYPFKVEYVIPQLLLQYVRQNSDIHGIKYFSTNVDYENSNTEVKQTKY